MPFFRRYRKYKGGKTGYRRRSYKKRSMRPRSRFRRYSAGAKISSINQRIYAMLKKMDMRFRYHKPKFTLVEKRKKSLRRGAGRVTKGQLAAMAAIKLQAAKNVAGMPRRAPPPASDFYDDNGDGMRVSLESLPSLEQIAQQELILEPMRASKRYAAASILDEDL